MKHNIFSTSVSANYMYTTRTGKVCSFSSPSGKEGGHLPGELWSMTNLLTLKIIIALEHVKPEEMEEEVVGLCSSRYELYKTKSLLHERGIAYDGVDQGTVKVYDGEEAADVIHQFCQNKSLPKPTTRFGYSRCMQATKYMPRLEPALLRINITDENGTSYGEELEIKDGEEPADRLYHTKGTNITHEIKHEFLMQNICTALPPGTQT